MGNSLRPTPCYIRDDFALNVSRTLFGALLHIDKELCMRLKTLFCPAQRSALAVALAALLSCTAEGPSAVEDVAAVQDAPEAPAAQAASFKSREEIVSALDSLAEAERSSGFRPGMGLAESGLREEEGDYAGAVIAAFKELLYAYGDGVLSAAQIHAGLEALMSRQEAEGADGPSFPGGPSGVAVQFTAGNAEAAVGAAALASLAFFDRRWTEAAEGLIAFCANEAPDSFVQWMFLTSLLESGLLKDSGEDTPGAENSLFGESRRAVLARYSAIRARYLGLAAYWYHLALVSGEGAERCVDLAPRGPYAGACRKILAENLGLEGSGAALRTKTEIERAVSSALVQGSAASLEELFPLLALEDNPFTLYALGALTALSASSLFRDYFAARSRESQGRLGERLRFIAGGRL
jgi:hypothetical protein